MKSFLLFVLILTTTLNIPTTTAQTAEDFARLPAISHPAISPSGNSIAYVTIANDEEVIVTKDLDAKNQKHGLGVIPLRGIHLSDYRWANDDRLIVTARMTRKSASNGEINLLRIFGVDRDGSNIVVFDMKPDKNGEFLQLPRIVRTLPKDPDHWLMQLDQHPDHFAMAPVHKVNIYTGEKTLVYANDRGFDRMIADADGNIRIGQQFLKGATESQLFYRLAGTENWRLLQETRYDDTALIEPIRIDDKDPNILLLSTEEVENVDESYGGGNIYRYDLTLMKVVGKYDNSVKENAKSIVKQKIPKVDVELVAAANPITLDKAIYELSSDVTPPQFILFNLAAKRIDFLGDSYPQLQNVTLSPMKKVEYTARDGLKIPAYLTVPAKSSQKEKPKLPMIIFPHGGPWAQDDLTFNHYVQFFASEGCAVFQPQFRGSTGVSLAHLEAGYKQWGLGIQDDITDGVQWLIKNEIADPNRICIVGASFGGYATAMGLATTPELYKCGVSINGVMDMPRYVASLNTLLYDKINKEVTNSKWDAKKVSPYHLAGQIKAPLLLIAGEKDTVVDNKHSKNMYDKIKKIKGSQYVELPKGEHWTTVESNEITKFKTMQKFLAQYLK